MAGAALTVGVLTAAAGWGWWPSDLRAADPAGAVRAVDGAAVEPAPLQPSPAPMADERPAAASGRVAAAAPETDLAAASEKTAPKALAGDVADVARPTAVDTGSTALPTRSGTGRRVVFSEGAQRVWLVGSDGVVERTYLVSGSVYDNLFPGTYEVYSRSESAVGIDDSGTMKHFVRFTQGTQGAAIGFHTIPVDDDGPVQTLRQLGTPLSHGCIRQALPDALALWDFAPIGTTVVVTP